MKKTTRTKFLLYNTGYDIWAIFLLKKKLNYKITRFILQYFNFLLRFKLLKILKKSNNFLKVTNLVPFHTQKYWKILSYQEPHLPKRNIDNTKWVKKWNYSKNPIKTKSSVFFVNLLKYYNLQYSVINKNSLLDQWLLIKRYQRRRNLNRLLFEHNYRYFYALEKKLPFVQRTKFPRKESISSAILQTHFCFKNHKNLTKYIVKISKLTNKHILTKFGLESVFLNSLFRTNIFPSTRYCYLAIKLGFLHLNNKICKNPYKLLNLYDTFFLNKKLLKKLSTLFLFFLKKNRIPINLPNYFSYNYNIFSFHIWRFPNPQEKSIIGSLPFRELNYPLSNFSKNYNINFWPRGKFKRKR